MMVTNLRRFAGATRARVKVRLRTGGWWGRLLYYILFSDAFRREKALVSAGHREYSSRLQQGSLEFLLRRNIHMLEKGLTMRPRRGTFATAYILETVDLYAKLVKVPGGMLSTDVESWATEVLLQFRDATGESDDPRIVAARARIGSLLIANERQPEFGPASALVGEAPLSIEALQALAVRRKSVRWFEQRPVDRTVIDRAVDVAREAPSACNRQPFEFRFFDDPYLVQQVAKIPMGTAGYGHNLPGICVIVGDQSAFIDERDRHLIYIDGSLAAMSLVFGLEAQGVASVCINWPDIKDRDERMSRLLKLEDHQRVVMLVGYGYADETGLVPRSAKRGIDAVRSYNSL